MKFTISVNKNYWSQLNKTEIFQLLESLGKEKKLGGLRIDKYKSKITDTGFILQRSSFGLDGFTLERYSLIKGEFLNENPTTINLQLKPDYFSIAFFFLFALIFVLAAIFAKHVTMNGVYRIPTLSDRFFFFGLGTVVPLTICYFSIINPVKKAEKWIVDRLNLSPL